jgi:hypothetical protein
MVLALGIVVAVVVVVLIAVLTIDLGPSFRASAERYGSRMIQRPLHMDRLGIRLRNGRFLVEGLRIEGLTPADHPFFTAKRIEVSILWWHYFRTHEVVIDGVDMSDWDMQVEMKDGISNFIKLPASDPTKKRPYKVTARRVDAVRGRFTYIDHGTWSTTSPNLTVHVDHDTGEYGGRADFSGGAVRIKDYGVLHSDMRCSFKIEGGKVHLYWIDLTTNGSHSVISGDVDFRRAYWPEMLYHVRTDEVDFAIMKDVFFAGEKFRVGGHGRFNGTFHLYKGGGRDLNGSFTSPLLTVNDFRFPDLAGDLRWLPDRFDVTKGLARFHGGLAHFTYSMAPLGTRQPATARFDTSYENVDLASLTDFLETKGLRLAGRASGRNVLEWRLGRLSEHHGGGEITVRAAGDVPMYSRTSAPLPQPKPVGPPPPRGAEAAPPVVPPNVGTVPNLGHLPIAGTLRYQFGAEWVDVGASAIATPSTYVEFSGRTAYGDRSSIDFYARSGDWQESDKLLSAVITAFGSPTRTVAVGGYGEFTGRLVNSFKRPRIEGAFTGDEVRAFDVVWGKARGKVVVDDGYVEVTNGVVTQGDAAELRADGRFSLSTPRADGAEEINTRVFLKDWPIPDLLHAFGLDGYPLNGRAGGEYHVYGEYRRPFGYGKMTVTDANAYGEPFERGSGTLALEGVGARLDSVELAKAGGAINGAAYLSWDGKYSFTAYVPEARRIPVEQVALLKFPQAPLSGLVSFKANGQGSFADPRYEITDVRIADLFAGDEGIGVMTGGLSVQDEVMRFNVDAVSTRLVVSGTGQIAMAPGADAQMSFRVTNTSLDPYIRSLNPSALSPFTSAIASGTVAVAGRLTDLEHLRVEANVDQLEMTLFDYRITNRPADNQPSQVLKLVFENNVIHLAGAPGPDGKPAALRLFGQDTSLALSGDINIGNVPYERAPGAELAPQSLDVQATGDANLGILQGLFADIRSSGRATIRAAVNGPLQDPAFTGLATVQNGRIRYFSLPHSIDAINGPIRFTTSGIQFGDPATGRDLTAQVGGGPVTFGGRIDVRGLAPTQWAVTASGTNIHLRYPEGFSSLVDANLSLVGPYSAPTLKGTVEVKSAEYQKEFMTPGLIELAASAGGNATGGAKAGAAKAGAAPAPAPSFPLRFNIRVTAPSALRVQNNLARLTASADLTLLGSYDHPLLQGGANIDRGTVTFEGKRYTITRGAIEFNNPTNIEPFFDFEAETRVRVPGQTYNVTLSLIGPLNKYVPDLSSDPPLPVVQILSILFGNVRAADLQNPELRALERPNVTEQQILSAQIAQLLLNTFSYNVGRVFEKAFNLSTVAVTPVLFDDSQHLSPSARFTIGRQFSDRAYVSISRSLYAPQEDIIYVLEYNQSDRISWVLSRNEDKTYSLDVRVRHVF